MSNKTLSRDSLLKANLKIKKVRAGKLGYVYIREMSGRQMLAYKEKAVSISKEGIINDVDSFELLALLVCNSICDESGKPQFSEADIPAMLENSLDTLMELGKLSETILEFNGIDVDKAKKEATNKLKNAQTNSSTIS